VKKTIYFTSILLIFTINSAVAQNCGVDRWSIKTLSDIDTLKIDFNHIVSSTVHEQVSLLAPKIKKGRLESETKVYSIDCNLIGFKRESGDKDIHVIVEDINTDETMVIEIPSHQCFEIQKTSRYKLFKDLQGWFYSNIGSPKSKFFYLKKHIPVTVTGVGFFDFNHGQIGMADNGREIHPVLSIKLK
jgi:hypothetical protein